MRRIQTKGHSTTYLRILQNCQGHEKQGEDWETIMDHKTPKRLDLETEKGH